MDRRTRPIWHIRGPRRPPGLQLATRLLPALAAATLLAPAAGHAQSSDAIGTGTGTTTNARCPDGQAITGAVMWADDAVRGIHAMCHLRNADGSKASSTANTPRIGNTGGTVNPNANCPGSSVVSGLDGSGGGTVNGLSIICRQLTAQGTVSGDETLVPLRALFQQRMKPEGEFRGNPVRCPNNRPAVGLFGVAGSTHLGRIGLLCDRALDLSAPRVSSLSLDPAAVVGGTASVATVQLDRQAPSAGTTVTWSVGPSLATLLPGAPQVIAAGGTTARFDVNTAATAQDTSVIV